MALLCTAADPSSYHELDEKDTSSASSPDQQHDEGHTSSRVNIALKAVGFPDVAAPPAENEPLDLHGEMTNTRLVGRHLR